MKVVCKQWLKRPIAILLSFVLLMQGVFVSNLNAYAQTVGEENNNLVVDSDEESLAYGDVNGDQEVTAEDALLVLQHTVKLIQLSKSQCMLADVDGNTHINAEDALWILKYVVKIISMFPIENIDVTPAPTATVSPSQTPTPSSTPSPTVAFSGKLWICGDSIAAVHGKDGYQRPVYGWGEVISDYFTNGVTVNNYANSGDSTKSYYYDGLGQKYKAVYQNLSKNDYVIISFGHNDHGGVAKRETDPTLGSNVQGSYKWYLKEKFIEPALAAGAVPILMSSVVRCNYSNGKFVEDEKHLLYGKAMQELVQEYANRGIEIPFIDAQQYTYQLYSGLTYDQASLYHALYQPGDWYFDNTHYCNAGAKMICEYITSQLKNTSLQIKDYIK